MSAVPRVVAGRVLASASPRACSQQALRVAEPSLGRGRCRRCVIVQPRTSATCPARRVRPRRRGTRGARPRGRRRSRTRARQREAAADGEQVVGGRPGRAPGRRGASCRRCRRLDQRQRGAVRSRAAGHRTRSSFSVDHDVLRPGGRSRSRSTVVEPLLDARRTRCSRQGADESDGQHRPVAGRRRRGARRPSGRSTDSRRCASQRRDRGLDQRSAARSASPAASACRTAALGLAGCVVPGAGPAMQRRQRRRAARRGGGRGARRRTGGGSGTSGGGRRAERGTGSAARGTHQRRLAVGASGDRVAQRARSAGRGPRCRAGTAVRRAAGGPGPRRRGSPRRTGRRRRSRR